MRHSAATAALLLVTVCCTSSLHAEFPETNALAKPAERQTEVSSALPAASALLDGILQRSSRAVVADSVEKVDADFAFQGEYYGTLPMFAGYSSTLVGLQVVALGDAEFEAFLFEGGLPGAGWGGRPKERLTGRRNANVLELTGEGMRFLVDGSKARLVTGRLIRTLGTLFKTTRVSSTMGRRPLPKSRILFDGAKTDQLVNASMTEDRLLKEGTMTRDAFEDYLLHVEFRLPYMPSGRGQGRSNSGIYLQQRYEVQILDSLGHDSLKNGCGGLYRVREPDVNTCYSPLTWQTYDIEFRSPRFNDRGVKIESVRITIRLNGVVVHDNVELTTKTGAGKPETPMLLPILFQNHRDPVRFRNIWLLARPASDAPPTSPATIAAN